MITLLLSSQTCTRQDQLRSWLNTWLLRTLWLALRKPRLQALDQPVTLGFVMMKMTIHWIEIPLIFKDVVPPLFTKRHYASYAMLHMKALCKFKYIQQV